MPIEFRCTNCDQLLRVPDDSAGKSARCPKCGGLATIPSPSPAAAAPPPPFVPTPASPFGDSPGTGSSNPFAADPPTKPSLNPYAPPTGGYAPTGSPFGGPSAYGALAPLGHQRVEIGDIWNYAWDIWKNNLGLLVGSTVIAAVINQVINIPFSLVQMVLQHNDAKEASVGVAVLGFFVGVVVQTFLNIGQIQIALKLARRHPATFADLFGGGSRLLPVIGLSLLTAIPLIIAALLLVVPAIMLILVFWPCYMLVLDDRAKVFDSFSIAAGITEGNRMTTFLMWLLGIAVVFVGFLACCVGVLFAAPLSTMIYVVAYLMMSGQLPAQPPLLANPGYAPPGALPPGK